MHRKGYPEEKGTESHSSCDNNVNCSGYRKGYPEEKGTESYQPTEILYMVFHIARAIPRKRELKADGCFR